MELYELTVITRKDEDAEIINKIISDLGGNITETKSLGSRRFAYAIQKEQSGFYTSFDFRLDKKSVLDLNNRLRQDDDIVRYLIITKKPQVEAPISELSAEMQAKTLPEQVETPESVSSVSVEETPVAATPEPVETVPAPETAPAEDKETAKEPKEKLAKAAVKTKDESPVEEVAEEVVQPAEKPEEVAAEPEIEEKPKEEPKKPADKKSEEDLSDEERLSQLNAKLDELLKD